MKEAKTGATGGITKVSRRSSWPFNGGLRESGSRLASATMSGFRKEGRLERKDEDKCPFTRIQNETLVFCQIKHTLGLPNSYLEHTSCFFCLGVHILSLCV